MPDCKDSCPVLPRVEALEEANRRHADTHQRIFDKIDTINRETGAQEEMLTAMDSKIDRMLDWQDDNRGRIEKIDTLVDISARVSALEAKPGKRWDGLVDNLIWAMAGAVLAWVVSGMPGLGT